MDDYDDLLPLEQYDQPLPFTPTLYHYADNGLISIKVNDDPFVFNAIMPDDEKVMADWRGDVSFYEWSELANCQWSIRSEDILNPEYCYPFVNEFKDRKVHEAEWATGWGSDEYQARTYGRSGYPYFDLDVPECEYQKNIWALFKHGKPTSGRSKYAIVHLPSGLELLHLCGFKDAKYISFVISNLFSSSGRTLTNYNIFYHFREALYDLILDEYLAFDRKHSDGYKQDAREQERRHLRRRL